MDFNQVIRETIFETIREYRQSKPVDSEHAEKCLPYIKCFQCLDTERYITDRMVLTAFGYDPYMIRSCGCTKMMKDIQTTTTLDHSVNGRPIFYQGTYGTKKYNTPIEIVGLLAEIYRKEYKPIEDAKKEAEEQARLKKIKDEEDERERQRQKDEEERQANRKKVLQDAEDARLKAQQEVEEARKKAEIAEIARKKALKDLEDARQKELLDAELSLKKIEIERQKEMMEEERKVEVERKQKERAKQLEEGMKTYRELCDEEVMRQASWEHLKEDFFHRKISEEDATLDIKNLVKEVSAAIQLYSGNLIALVDLISSFDSKFHSISDRTTIEESSMKVEVDKDNKPFLIKFENSMRDFGDGFHCCFIDFKKSTKEAQVKLRMMRPVRDDYAALELCRRKMNKEATRFLNEM
jgi:hypothetical protein